MKDLLLKVHNLKKIFPVKAGTFSSKNLMLKAVDGVSFELKRGEILGLVGESGCGKTTLGRCLIRIYEPDGGRVFLDPESQSVNDVIALDEKIEQLETKLASLHSNSSSTDAKQKIKSLEKEIESLHSDVEQRASFSDILSMSKQRVKKSRQRIQMVFQDPWASLNPRMLVKDIIGEGPKEFGLYKGKALEAHVYSLIEKVGLPPVAGMRYPHEFSGGQRQRIGIARALALQPSLIICDEPVSALDVSIQAQIINLLIALQSDYELTYVFIAHDISVVQYIADRIAVMYLGKIVEIAQADLVYNNPQHPYTISLMSAVPVADPNIKTKEILLEGDVPSPVNPPSGCTFHPRCPHRIDICSQKIPKLITDESGRAIACHNPPHKK